MTTAPSDYDYLRPEEVQRFLVAADTRGPRDALAARVLVRTGMREGELCPLVRRDIDLAKGTIELRRCLVRRASIAVRHSKRTYTKGRRKGTKMWIYSPGKELVVLLYDKVGLTGEKLVGKPKEVFKATADWSRNSDLIKRGLKANQPARTVPIRHRTTLALLRDWVDGMEGREFVFKSREGAFLGGHGLYNRMKGALLEAGIEGRRAHVHITRHTFAVNFLKAGGKLESLRRILGHTDIRTTAIYLQFVVEDLIEEADKLGDIY